MLSEISEFDIPDRQLLATGAKPGVSISTDIGKAKITHTIFGRARVRIIRERDNKRRAWLLGALAVIAIVAAGWQGWTVLQQTESHPASLPLSARIRVSAPTTQPENIHPAATPPSVTNKPLTPLQTEINKLMTSQKSALQPPPGLNAPGQMAAKPVTAQPVAPSVATPRAMSPVSQPAANSPAAVVPLADPLAKKNTSTLSPAGDNQPAAPVNAQP